jgi:endo-1,4-beta-xylanase
MGLLVDGITINILSVDMERPKDYQFLVEIPSGNVEIDVAFLNDLQTDKEDRNLYLDRITIIPPPGVANPAPLRPDEVKDEYDRKEQAVLAATDQAIEKNRKGDGLIRLVDEQGRAPAGVKVQIKLVRHDFLFGCNLFMFNRFPLAEESDTYKQRFEEMFNYATTAFYWRWYEPVHGKPDYLSTDRETAWCGERGIMLKGHPLVWGDEGGIPTWTNGPPPKELQRQRVFDLIRRYHDRIGFWEVVNEPTRFSDQKIDEPFRWAREAEPSAYLLVNDAGVFADGQLQYFRLLSEAIARDVSFDGVGIQAHDPAGVRFPLVRVQKILDHYATLGKELHITEFTPTSGGEPVIESPSQGVWDEATQAEYAVQFYRVCFAHPAVRAITWWDLSDRNSWRKGGGMLRSDLTPKPVYNELKHLIHDEWDTGVAGQSDADGRLSFRGFYGDYRIIIDLPNKQVEKEFHLERGQKNDIVISYSSAGNDK